MPPAVPPGSTASPASALPAAELLSSRETAERLGVKLETLYAYAARGLIHGEPAADGGARGTRYAPHEVEAFLARRRGARDPEAAAARALFWGRPVIESAIARAEGGRLFYRGHDAVGLAESACFEQVAELLWSGALPHEIEEWPHVDAGELPELPRGRAVGLEALPWLIASIGLTPGDVAYGDTERDAARMPAGVGATARRAIARLVAALAAVRGAPDAEAAGRGPMAARVLAALGGQPGGDAVRMVDRALVLGAEHELNASTFAARVAASTGADPHSVLCAAAATLGGPRHGGMTARVEALVRQPAPLPDGLDADIAGFGHKLYPSGDPRVPPLLAAARSARPATRSPELEAVFAIVDAMAARGADAPTLDLGLVATACALGLPAGSAGLLFALGRTAGWIAHAIEQYASEQIIRPRARYVGPAPEDAP